MYILCLVVLEGTYEKMWDNIKLEEMGNERLD